MSSALIRPGHKILRNYYETRRLYSAHNVEHESAVRYAFLTLLDQSARLRNWVVIQELALKVSGRPIRPDAVVQDDYHLYRGYYEAKDTHDNLDQEIRRKLALGYPGDNITLAGIPPDSFNYRLSHRSALDWVIDQHQLKQDGAGNISSDPNRLDDPEYILRLIGQVITVSIETNRLTATLAALPFS